MLPLMLPGASVLAVFALELELELVVFELVEWKWLWSGSLVEDLCLPERRL